jgi:hypothetical protein
MKLLTKYLQKWRLWIQKWRLWKGLDSRRRGAWVYDEIASTDHKPNELEMARRCYGYGRWDAPYWFIGPEEGMDGHLKERLGAWLKLGRETGLSDCRTFHEQIGVTKWHRETPSARLQPTWKALILLLFAFQGEHPSKDQLRTYQRSRWGSRRGETCVIELSGLPAKNLAEGLAQRGRLFTSDERDAILQERIKFIRDRINKHKLSLKFVVMYGKGSKVHWEKIAGCSLTPDGVVRSGSILFAFAPHPQERGRRNEDWKNLGKRLYEESQKDG